MTRPSTRRILVLGAPAGIRASIAAARAAGFCVIAADANPDAGALAHADEAVVCPVQSSEAVIDAATRYRADGIIATTDFAVVSASIASRALGLPGIDPEAARNAVSKARMRECWTRSALSQPRVVAVRDRSALDAAATQLGFPVVCKPANALGGGSRGISIADGYDTLQRAWDAARAVAPDGIVLVEQCVPAISEHSVEVLFHNGTAHVLAIGDKVKTPLPFRVDLAVCYPTSLSADMTSRVEALAMASARSLGIDHGMAHVEIGVTSDGPQLFELGARCGGGATAAPVVPLATGIDEFVEACRVACGDAPLLTRAVHQRGVCYRFVVPEAGRNLTRTQIAAVRAMPGIMTIDVWGVDPDAGDTTVRCGSDRIGALVATGATRDDAASIAAQALGLLAESCDDGPVSQHQAYSPNASVATAVTFPV